MLPFRILSLILLLCVMAHGELFSQAVNSSVVFQNRLSIPQLLDPPTENGEKTFTLTLQKGETELVPGKVAMTFGINGSYLGPTLRVRTGDRVRMRVTNTLGTETTIHWHGMELPAVMDGVYQIIQPNATWEPRWTIRNEAATLWYHAHLMGHTGEQVYRGLAGMIIVDDSNSESLALPHRYGVDDIPVIIQDKKIDANGQLVYEHHSEPVAGPQGFLGNTILVNGTFAPFVEVPRGWLRLRLLNASNGRRFNFGFDDNRPFYQIASGGGLLEAPVKETRLVVAPGSRAEILVDMAQGSSVRLMSYSIRDIDHAGTPIARFLLSFLHADRDENQEFKILEIRPTGEAEAREALPEHLNTIPRPDVKRAIRSREFIMDRDSRINGRTMDPAVVNQIVVKDEPEIWQIVDASPNFHTFHVHDVQFLIVDRNGRPPEPNEQGWEDNLLLYPGDQVRILVEFRYATDPHRPYMFHCHILEHEDMGMMGQFVVIDRGAENQVSVDPAYIHEYIAHSDMQ
ncbi:MAG TPA: multicopper oxidase domain-containing protein [Spirochaetia bacterium]|nr:multicopper oxidase domain-containing protein [Spirochaetia bacterium]